MNYSVRKLDQEAVGSIYQSYMTRDFPSSELKPLSHIIRSMEQGYGFTMGIYKETELMGYAVFIVAGGYALLDYFAIVEEYRGKGVGHEAFHLLTTYFEENFSQIRGIYIEAERIDKARNEEERVVRGRRIAFYQSCGCVLTQLESTLFGVAYSIMYYGLGQTEAPPSLEAVDLIYRTMFKKTHYNGFVKLGIAGGKD